MTTAAQPSSALRILCRTTAAVALLAFLPMSGAVAQVMPTKDSAPLTARPSDPAWVRADALVKQMTLDEKITYLHGLFPPMAKPAPTDMIPSAGYVPGVPRLNIPTLRESDASLGVANQVEQRKGDVATALPSSLALASTFEPKLAFDGGAMIGAEARAKTFNVLLAGGVNLTRDPWAGRNFEYLGEDPLLAGEMVAEQIKGVQSNKIVSTIKHFALNAQETGRHVMDAQIDEADLRESDLLAFQIAIEKSNPASVMCAYNKVNGDWACENDFLLNKVLKRDWNYPGWVMSDWGAVHSTVKAALAGLDQQSGQELDAQIFFGEDLKAAVAKGEVSQARVDDMVRRILHGVISSGLMDNPTPTSAQPIDYDAHAKVAQTVAERGSVLLKNDRGLLPLAKSAKKIVLIGAHADVGVISGGGSSQVRSVGGAPVEIPLNGGEAASFVRVTWHASSPLQAIKAANPNAEVSYIDGKDPVAAAAAAKDADVAIVFAWHWQTEAQDAPSIALPENQDALIEAVSAANKNAVVVLETGGPVLMPWLDKVGVVLQAWYPGQRGGQAIARLLFGEVNPSGRLAMTFPKSEDQAPRASAPGFAEQAAIDDARRAGQKAGPIKGFPVRYVEGAAVGYRWFAQEKRRPLYPFGYGLSYTSFGYKNLKVEDGDGLKVSFDVTNTGKVAGADTPQLYVTSGQRKAMLRLAGFQKVDLAPGETKRVTLTVEPRILADYDTAKPGWTIAAGTYPLYVGRNAGEPVLTGSAKLKSWSRKP
ncbi:beta-glucosidase [Caulobacter vibrioides]|uniref:beta-glucosidase n=1 Tax=Caulobacter vibrioides TaxID=155892 RepID=UPI000BB475F4|nr:glycoside hydrolase family 3 protein [Caulobacter vibrioides]ATC24752.1 glycosyl hydrolase [Caulobacter vibrioides]AZH12892.1 beta-glucosidase [Caulobacter vibrioides]PLR09528.1 glycosyl hydrolase [Caulobacter vibrioides]